jgi:hypothetical protein
MPTHSQSGWKGQTISLEPEKKAALEGLAERRGKPVSVILREIIDNILAREAGESGPKKRPIKLDWMRSIRDQCKAAGVAYFAKQIDKIQPIPTRPDDPGVPTMQ